MRVLTYLLCLVATAVQGEYGFENAAEVYKTKKTQDVEDFSTTTDANDDYEAFDYLDLPKDRKVWKKKDFPKHWGDLAFPEEKELLHLLTALTALVALVHTAAVKRSTTAGIYGRVVPIPAGTKAHYNIQNFAGPGTYKFGYDSGSGPNQSFRQEERGPDGKVKGRYGYVEPSGALRVVEYMADSTGFHILKTRTMVPDMKPKPAVRVRTPFVGPLPPFIPTSYVVNLAG